MPLSPCTVTVMLAAFIQQEGEMSQQTGAFLYVSPCSFATGVAPDSLTGNAIPHVPGIGCSGCLQHTVMQVYVTSTTEAATGLPAAR
jgi:hypothetical protein